MVTLLASAERTANGDSGAVNPAPLRHPELLSAARFVLTVSAAASVVGDTLDVYIQQAYDGTNYDDVVHFTQVKGDGGAKKYIAEWYRKYTPESEMHAPSDAAVAAGVVQGARLTSPLKIKWVIAGAGDHKFTFKVDAEFFYD